MNLNVTMCDELLDIRKAFGLLSNQYWLKPLDLNIDYEDIIFPRMILLM